MGRARLRPLLASTSLAALLIGGGTPAAFAACTPAFNFVGAPPQLSVTNPSGSTIDCINIVNTPVAGNVTNEQNAVISPGGPNGPFGVTNVGINISNSSIGGAVVNAGQITVPSGKGILITNDAIVSRGISNAGTISAGNGILVSTVATFAGGISNSGTVSAGSFGFGIEGIGVATFAGE